MKSSKFGRIRRAVKYVRIDPYTWIEKRAEESDEEARQRFLMKLARAMDLHRLQPGL